MVIRPLLAAAVALMGLLVAAPTAHADSTDQKFLAALKEQGIFDQASSAHAIEAGHYVCVRLDNGQTPADVMQEVLHSSSLTEFHTGYFVAESIYVYCPRHVGEVPKS